jgi:hypothetical protein
MMIALGRKEKSAAQRLFRSGLASVKKSGWFVRLSFGLCDYLLIG